MAQGKTGDNRKVDYTVVKKEDLPAEVKKVIDSKKQERFQMTYQGEGELYIMKGYGISRTCFQRGTERYNFQSVSGGENGRQGQKSDF